MNLFTLITLMAALASALPIAVHLAAMHKKREVVTATTTSQVIVTLGKDVTFTDGPDTYTTASSSIVAPTSLYAFTDSAEPSSKPEIPGDSTVPAGGSKGITYSPYTSDGQCKTFDQVKLDFKQLQEFDLVRIYDTDCQQVENVIQAKSKGQKLLLGIFHMDQISTSVSTIANAVNLYGSWDDIYAVTVGNELESKGETASSLAGHVSSAKSALSSYGYSGKVTTVNVFNSVTSDTSLCSVGDFVAINAHAYFDSSCEAGNAGTWLKNTVADVAKACGVDSSEVLVTESGWPSLGDSNGQAVASKDNQAKAISSIKELMGGQTFLFTAFNDFWKSPGYLSVEQSFGILL